VQASRGRLVFPQGCDLMPRFLALAPIAG
jgi:hypothetical protein